MKYIVLCKCGQYDESAGSVSCYVEGNKTQFRFDVNCFYTHSGDISNIKEWINNKEALIYTSDKEIASIVKKLFRNKRRKRSRYSIYTS